VSRSLSRLQGLLLGLVVLIGLGLAAAGLFAIGNRQWLWSDTFHVQVGFKQVRGVEVGTRVRVQGIDAGEVVAVLAPASPGSEVRLLLRIDGKLHHLVRADASAQIVGEGMIGGKVIDIHPGTDRALPVADGDTIASRPATELTDVLAQVDGALQDMRKGQGSLGKLMKEEEAYRELVELLRQGRGTLHSIQQDADALKDMPIVRNYIRDAHKLLVRPDCERNRQWFAERDLFEPGHAVLTVQGRQQLDRLVPWLDGLKHKNSEVVVSSYADTTVETRSALTVTQKQSEAVVAYLKDHHAVQKMGWFSSRKVTPIGLGSSAPPAENEKLPVPRVDVLVFVPQG
jgi:phospholipid/cholesterol/gamma-HCH transport system substrate-binding protein